MNYGLKFVGVAALTILVLAVVVSSNDEKDKKDIGTVIGIDLGTTYSW
jgi:hypothetical protein